MSIDEEMSREIESLFASDSAEEFNQKVANYTYRIIDERTGKAMDFMQGLLREVKVERDNYRDGYLLLKARILLLKFELKSDDRKKLEKFFQECTVVCKNHDK